MRYSVSIDKFASDIRTQVRFCRDSEVKCVEAAVRDAGDPAYEKYIKDSAEIFGKSGIEIGSFHAPYWPDSISMDDAEKRGKFVEALAKNIEVFGKCCPGKIVVIHPGELIDSKNDLGRLIETAVASIKVLAETASKYGLYIAIENMRHGDDSPAENFRNRLGEDPRTLIEILDGVKYDKAGICFDTGHANIAGDIMQKLKECSGRIIHTHISDNLGVKDNHFLPEKGNIQWKTYFDILKASGFNGCVNLEIAPQEGMGAETAIRESKKRLQKYIDLA